MSDATKVLGAIILLILLVAIAVVISAAMFEVLWNHFVVTHLTGARPTNFTGAIWPSLFVGGLTGAAAGYRSRS